MDSVYVQLLAGDDGNVSVLLSSPADKPDPMREEPVLSDTVGDKGGRNDDTRTLVDVSKALCIDSADDLSQPGPAEAVQARQNADALHNSRNRDQCTESSSVQRHASPNDSLPQPDIPAARFVHRDHPSLYPGQVQVEEGAWKLQQTLSQMSDAWYLYEVVHDYSDGSVPLLLDIPSKRLFKQQASGPVLFVGNLVCTGQGIFAVEKAQPSVLFFQRFNSSLVGASVQALEDLVMPHMSADGACSCAGLAELCQALKPDASEMDKDCFKVLMNPEDPFYADGVDPSLRAVALRVGEASELEAALCEEQGEPAVQMQHVLSALEQHLKSAWKPRDLLREVEGHVERGFGGLCKFLQSLSPALRFTMHDLRGILLHTRLWCCAGLHSSKPCALQMSAADVLRAWNVAPLRVIGATSQEPHSEVAGAGSLRLDQTRTVKVKAPVRKKTTIIRSSDTTMFGDAFSTSPAKARRTRRPAAGTASPDLEQTSFQMSLKKTQYESLEQHLIGPAARHRQDAASGASSHINRLRTPTQTRRAHLFASLKNSAYATVWDPVTGQEVRGKVTTVEYKPGVQIEPVWESLPFDTQKLLNSPAARSPKTPDIHSTGMGANAVQQESVPHEEEELQQARPRGHKQVEAPALLQTTRRFANMRVGEHAPAGAPGATVKAALGATLPKAVGNAPPAGGAAQVPQEEAASAVSRRPASPPHSTAAPATTAGSSVPATPPSSSLSPAPRAAQDQELDLAANHSHPGAEQAVPVLPSAATGISPEVDAYEPSRMFEGRQSFEEHEATRLYTSAAMAGKISASRKPKQDAQRTRPVAPFVTGGQTITKQSVGNIYDGRYNRSRLLKPGPATIKTHVLCMDEETGGAAWFPVTQDQSYSRLPARVESITTEELRSEAFAEAALPSGAAYNSRAGLSIQGDMYSRQPGGWKSPKTAAYLYDQMT